MPKHKHKHKHSALLSSPPPESAMSHAASTPILVSVDEAARLLGLSRARIYELLSQGAIESVRIGRTRRIPVDALHEFAAKLREG